MTDMFTAAGVHHIAALPAEVQQARAAAVQVPLQADLGARQLRHPGEPAYYRSHQPAVRAVPRRRGPALFLTGASELKACFVSGFRGIASRVLSAVEFGDDLGIAVACGLSPRVEVQASCAEGVRVSHPETRPNVHFLAPLSAFQRPVVWSLPSS